MSKDIVFNGTQFFFDNSMEEESERTLESQKNHIVPPEQPQIQPTSTIQDESPHSNRPDKNAPKAVNPIFTKIGKKLFGVKRVFFPTNYPGASKNFNSVKSNKSYWTIWMVFLQQQGPEIQYKAFQMFKQECQAKIKKGNLIIEVQFQLRLACQAFQLYMSGEIKKSLEKLYKFDLKQMRQIQNLKRNLAYIQAKRNKDMESFLDENEEFFWVDIDDNEQSTQMNNN